MKLSDPGLISEALLFLSNWIGMEDNIKSDHKVLGYEYGNWNDVAGVIVPYRHFVIVFVESIFW
jgi:hypothetical protein